jgi:protein involved in polysaccharide export with SLBB domain
MMRAPAPCWQKQLLLAVLGILIFAFAGEVKAQDDVVRIGDILSISLPGEPALNKDFQVDRQGRVILPEVGEVQVAGRTLTEATRVIRDALSRAYREVQRVRVTVKEHRLILSVLGYVKNPAEVNLPASANVQEAIAAAGGFTQGAQLNKLQVRRGNQVIEFDLKKYLDTGDASGIPRLQPLDILFVPASPVTGNVEINFDGRTLYEAGDAADLTQAVKVFGEVVKPGVFGYRPDLTVVDMILRAGGVNIRADIDQIRLVNDNKPSIFNMQRYLDTGDKSLLPTLKPGATIFVPRQSDAIRKGVNTVYVMGQVNKPGAYDTQPGVSFIDVISNAGGPSRYGDTRLVKVLHADGSVENVDLLAYSQGERVKLPQMRSGDTIFVPMAVENADRPSWLKITPDRAVEIIGEVVRPGRYEWSDQMSLFDLFGEAGGPTVRADLANVQILQSRDSRATPVKFNVANFLAGGGSLEKVPKIRAGYVIFVPQLPESPIDNKSKWLQIPSDAAIYIIGQVGIPGRYAFNNSLTFLDILSAANGPTATADLRNVRVSHREKNGTARVTQVNLALYFATGDEKLIPKVRPGDVIFVPDRVNRDWIDDPKEVTVRVIGAVQKPGRYHFLDSMTILDLLAEAGGPTNEAYQNKIVVVNIGGNDEKARVFDLVAFAKTGDINMIPPVRAGDTIYVPNMQQAAWKQFQDAVSGIVPIAALIVALFPVR